MNVEGRGAVRGTIGSVNRRWSVLPVAARDGVFAAVLAAVSFLPSLENAGLGLAVPGASRGFDALTAVLILGQSLPLALRRRAPAWCLGIVAASYFVQQGAGGRSMYFAGMGLVIALYSAAAHQKRGRAVTAAALTVAFLGLVIELNARGTSIQIPDAVTFYGLYGAFWALGVWVRRQAIKESASYQREAELAVVTERARIARELHDVVTHHVTAMVVQADAASFLPGAPARVSASLETIAETGRQALVELRHQLGVLQPGASGDADRVPAIDRLADIVERARASGQPVRLVERGNPQELTGPVGLAICRVVQEALTNAIKHAPARDTIVTVARTAAEIEVDIMTTAADPSSATRSPSLLGSSGSGRGLLGLAERVGLLGGEFEAGPVGSGGFRVNARIPVGAS